MPNQKEIKFELVSRHEAQEKGFKTLNDCNHYIADMSHLKPNTDDSMNTLSINLPNGRQVAICLIQCSPTMFDMDISFKVASYVDSIKAMRFYDGKSEIIKGDGMYAIVVDNDYRKEKVKFMGNKNGNN